MMFPIDYTRFAARRFAKSGTMIGMAMPEQVLARIEQSVLGATRLARDCSTVDSFELLLDPGSEMVYLNYAVPLPGATLGSGAAHRLIEAFRERNRTPRLEFTRDLWPELEQQLVNHGFVLEDSQPMMVCLRTEFTPYQSGDIEVSVLTEGDDVRPYYDVANGAFGMEIAVDEARLARNRREMREGTLRLGLASLGGINAGCAATMHSAGICELAGVGTLPEFRRRGVASVISSLLLDDHFREGDLAWLSAGSDEARRVYERLGFRTVATRVNYILPGT